MTTSTGDDSNNINKVVADLKSTSDSLNTTLGRLLSYLSSDTPSTDTEDITQATPDRPAEVVEPASQDMSSVSLDGFMFTDDGSENDLN